MEKTTENESGVRLGPAEVVGIVQALDALALALAGHGHTWTPRERESYERAIALLTPVWRIVPRAGPIGGLHG
jgi:hypothetical protein